MASLPSDSVLPPPHSGYGDLLVTGLPTDTPIVKGMVPMGESGDPLPYSVGSDSLVVSLFLVGLLLMMIGCSYSGKFIQRHMKGFFHYEKARTTTVPDTSSEIRGLCLLVFNTALVMGVGSYLFAHQQGYEGFLFLSPQVHLLFFVGWVMVYFLLKILAYLFIDWVFFDKKKNLQWHKSLLLLTAMEGVLLYPLVLMLPYVSIPAVAVLAYAALIVILAKFLSFYKAFIIFFRRTGSLLQIFLYFCALEIMPLVVIYGVMAYFYDYLKINF